MKPKQILIPIVCGTIIMVALVAGIAIYNFLVPILATYKIELQQVNQLNAGNIAVVAYFVGLALATLFGVILPKDEDQEEANGGRNSVRI